jgi:hypothetical protein
MRRKLVGLAAITSRRKPPRTRVAAAVPFPQRLVLAGTASLAGRQWIVAGYPQEHAAGVPLEDVDHKQERLKQGDKQHRPGDVERAVLQPEGEPLDPEHEDAKQFVHPGPHNLAVRIASIVQDVTND